MRVVVNVGPRDDRFPDVRRPKRYSFDFQTDSDGEGERDEDDADTPAVRTTLALWVR